MPPKPRRTRTKEKTEGLKASRITVAVRARPLLPGEVERGWNSVVNCIGGKVVVLTDPSANSDDVLRRNRSHDRRFAFDHVLDGDTSQREVYTRVARPLLKSFVGMLMPPFNPDVQLTFLQPATTVPSLLMGQHPLVSPARLATKEYLASS
jgi:hypothetical protein